MQMYIGANAGSSTVPGGLDYRRLFDCDDLIGSTSTYERNGEIHGEGEAADFVYKVISGAVRSLKILSDGRRQVNSFHLPGDIFGLEAGDEHWCAAEAIGPTKILVVRRAAIERAAQRHPDVAAKLYAHAVSELHRAQEHSVLLIRSAQERVVSFLGEMVRRTGGSPSIDLPMPRQDIADYLGLTIETVSRTMTQLTANAAIQIKTARRIVLCDRRVLDELED